MQTSVIICAHNPTPDYLRRVLEALRRQTLPTEQWELLLIDNDSDEPLASHWDLSWHPSARCIRESKRGLTAARLRGIAECIGDLLVFVDDDNVLAPDYLANANTIAEAHPQIGAFGGRISAEFESPTEQWVVPFLTLLAIREVQRDIWSNLYSYETAPCGAGLCVRRNVVEAYAESVHKDKRRAELGRCGTSLNSSEDSDLVFTACDLNYGSGLFQSLQMTHLLPAKRLSRRYLVKLCEEMTYSSCLLEEMRKLPRRRQPWGIRAYMSLRQWLLPSNLRALYRANNRGMKRAYYNERFHTRF